MSSSDFHNSIKQIGSAKIVTIDNGTVSSDGAITVSGDDVTVSSTSANTTVSATDDMTLLSGGEMQFYPDGYVFINGKGNVGISGDEIRVASNGDNLILTSDVNTEIVGDSVVISATGSDGIKFRAGETTAVTVRDNEALQLKDQTADVSSPAAGDIESVKGKIAIHDGTQWNRVVQQIYASVTNSSEISNTTALTAFDKSVTVPADTLMTGTTVRIKGRIYVVAVDGTPGLTISVRIDGTIFSTFVMATVTNGTYLTFNADAIMRGTGTNIDTRGTGIGVGNGSIGTLWTAFDASTLDTDQANDIEVTAAWTAAHVDNRVRLEMFIVDITGGS